MKTLLLALTTLIFTGCASLDTAGVSTLSIQPIEVQGKTVCCAVEVKDGKQYASVKLKMQKVGEDYLLDLSAQDVEAFRGQAQAADALGTASNAAVKGAALAVGAAALPAAVGVVNQVIAK